mmetsp:Transcript_27931/g.24704  ORF Transcript_27931/g.24704 Transcript_27931/m.24704 type:complete len:104 (-) Transcript_27931:727-1038(-)
MEGFGKKSLKHSRPQAVSQIEVDHKPHRSKYEVRMNNYMDIKDYLTQAKLSTPNNNKTKDNKYIKNVKENKLESVKNESKQISNYNRNELIKNKRNNCKSMLK